MKIMDISLKRNYGYIYFAMKSSIDTISMCNKTDKELVDMYARVLGSVIHGQQSNLVLTDAQEQNQWITAFNQVMMENNRFSKLMAMDAYGAKQLAEQYAQWGNNGKGHGENVAQEYMNNKKERKHYMAKIEHLRKMLDRPHTHNNPPSPASMLAGK